jgi:hypothetical protein
MRKMLEEKKREEKGKMKWLFAPRRTSNAAASSSKAKDGEQESDLNV